MFDFETTRQHRRGLRRGGPAACYQIARSRGVDLLKTWTDEELERIGKAQELQLAPARADGSLWPFTTMWVVRVGDEIYVRSAGGPERAWYRHARTSGAGRIRTGGVQRDVTFGEAAAGAHDAIDAAYHDKYDRYGPSIVNHVIGPAARAVTVRLVPAPNKK